MAEKGEDASKEKIVKLTKVLKELEDKYKKVYKDRNSLLLFIKSIIVSNSEMATLLDAPPGQVETEKMLAIYKAAESGKAKTEEDVEALKKKAQDTAMENVRLKERENEMKIKIEQMAAKITKLETELQDQAKKQANDGANVLLAKLKKAGSLDLPIKSDSIKTKASLESKIREQADLILSLKSQLSDTQSVLSQSLTQIKPDVQSYSVQTNLEEEVSPVSEAEALKKQLVNAQKSFEDIQAEYNVSFPISLSKVLRS